jgi:hypothetical protein
VKPSQVEQCIEVRLIDSALRGGAAEVVKHQRERLFRERILERGNRVEARIELHVPATAVELLRGLVEQRFRAVGVELAGDVGLEIESHAANARRNWAPELHRAGGRWIAYFTTVNAADVLSIGTATSSTLTGPFEPQPAPLVEHPEGVIDPTFFRDDDGSSWLVYKIDANASGKPTTIVARALWDGSDRSIDVLRSETLPAVNRSLSSIGDALVAGALFDVDLFLEPMVAELPPGARRDAVCVALVDQFGALVDAGRIPSCQ